MTSILGLFCLDGQRVIVTGSGRGIGAVIAEAIADEGTDMVVSALSPEETAETAAKVRQRGRRALMVPCDVMDLA